MTMINNEKEAIDSVKELIRLLITLSTATLVFSGVFFENYIITGKIKEWYIIFLFGSWIILIFSMVSGLFFGYSRIVTLQQQNNFNVYDLSLRLSFIIQKWSFIIGISLLGIFILIDIIS